MTVCPAQRMVRPELNLKRLDVTRLIIDAHHDAWAAVAPHQPRLPDSRVDRWSSISNARICGNPRFPHSWAQTTRVRTPVRSSCRAAHFARSGLLRRSERTSVDLAGSDLGAGTRLYWPALVAAYDGRPVGDYSPRRRRWPCVGSTRPPRGSSRCCDTQSVARPAVGDGGLQPLRALPASGRPPSLTKHAAYHRRPQQMFGSVDHAGHSQKGGRNLGVGFRRGLDE